MAQIAKYEELNVTENKNSVLTQMIEMVANVRSISIPGKTKKYFDGTAIALIMGFKNPRDAIINHCSGAVLSNGESSRLATTTQLSNDEKKLWVSEFDVYRLGLKSPVLGKKFDEWIFEHLIPSIGRTGHYDIGEVLKTSINSDEIENECSGFLPGLKVIKTKEYGYLILAKSLADMIGYGDKQTTMLDIIRRNSKPGDIRYKAKYVELVSPTGQTVSYRFLSLDEHNLILEKTRRKSIYKKIHQDKIIAGVSGSLVKNEAIIEIAGVKVKLTAIE